MDSKYFLIILLWIAFGIMTSNVAGRKGRDPFIWFFVGLLLSWLGLIIIFLLPRASSSIKPQMPASEEMSDIIEITPKEVAEEEVSVSVTDKQWHYLNANHEQLGPVGESELKKLWSKEEINEKSYVWSDGMSDWTAISEQSELLASLKRSQ